MAVHRKSDRRRDNCAAVKALWVAHSPDRILGSVDYLARCPRIDVVNITRADAELHRMYLEVCASNPGSDICAAVDLILLPVAAELRPQLTLMFFLHFAEAV
jgi:hypothetical protein